MLHTRTLAVAAASPILVENVLPSWLLRASSSHVVSMRSIGDRALYRGQISREIMLENYQKIREKYKSKKLPQDVNPKGVFSCNELDLKEVQVYGFDYDYTLACYKPSMDYLLYNLGRDMLIQKYKYPEGITNLEYKKDFAVRGLHYDIEKGLLLKLDSFLQIQFGTVYRGLHPVPDDEVLRLYKNRIIPIAYVEAPHKHSHETLHRTKMVQLADLFSVPEMGLLCNVTEYFLRNHIDYHPEILFRDVKNSVQSCHPIMHGMVVKNVSEYLEQNRDLKRFFDRLKRANKKMFLVTNSPFHFVDIGMKFLVGDDWKDYFDVVIVQARKPKFFTEESRPLRIYDEINKTQLWDRVTKLEKGVIIDNQNKTTWTSSNTATIRPNNVISQQRTLSMPQLLASRKDTNAQIELMDNRTAPELKLNKTYGPPKPPRMGIALETRTINSDRNFDKSEIRTVLQNWQMNLLMNDEKIIEKRQLPTNYRSDTRSLLRPTRVLGDGKAIDLQNNQVILQPKKSLNRRREPRRHTLQNGIDYNMMKRMKQIEQEKDVLLQGLAAVDKAREWYLKQISSTQEKIKHLGRMGSHVEQWTEAQQERLELQRARVLEVNRHLAALISSWERGGLPLHMNLAFLSTPTSSQLQQDILSRLKQQNHRLTEEVTKKNQRITILEQEKDNLVRELYNRQTNMVQSRRAMIHEQHDQTFM